jgi:hypothetical protein
VRPSHASSSAAALLLAAWVLALFAAGLALGVLTRPTAPAGPEPAPAPAVPAGWEP